MASLVSSSDSILLHSESIIAFLGFVGFSFGVGVGLEIGIGIGICTGIGTWLAVLAALSFSVHFNFILPHS